MRRMVLVLSLLVASWLALAGSGLGVVAQAATPVPGEDELAGVTFEPLAITAGVTLPSPADLVVVRIGLEPGASLPSESNAPSLAVVLVEEG